jgi:predicted Mrr-cat superfamily restriction endonuclease
MRELPIAYGNSCYAKKWSNKKIPFDDLCQRLEHTVRTPETVEEYPKLPKTERDRTKDKGVLSAAALKTAAVNGIRWPAGRC